MSYCLSMIYLNPISDYLIDYELKLLVDVYDSTCIS